MGRDELWSTNKKVIARILTYPNCSNTVSWRKFIRHVVLWYSLSIVIRQLPLLREEFRIPKSTFHSDLRRRAASRLALPCTSSFTFYCMFYFTCDRALRTSRGVVIVRNYRSIDSSTTWTLDSLSIPRRLLRLIGRVTVYPRDTIRNETIVFNVCSKSDELSLSHVDETEN